MKKAKRFDGLNSIAFLMAMISLQIASVAQPTLSVSASKNTIRTGEPVTIQLKADWPGHTIQKGFIIPDSFPHFEVWDKGNAVASENGFTQNITITSYDSGRFIVPPLELAEMTNSKTDSFAINVQPVNVDSLQDYHDIKDIIEVPPVPQWPFVLFITALTVVSIIALYFLLRKTKMGSQTVTGKVAKAGAYQRAMDALQKLQPQTQQIGPAKPFYTALISIYRTYLHEAYRYRSLQQTGGELIIQAKPLLTEESFYQLANSIRLSDAVKFAKYEPAQMDWASSLAIITKTVEEMERRLSNSNQQQNLIQKP